MLDAQVTRRREVAENIISLELCAQDGALLPAFTAGAHIDVLLPNGMLRQYSLINAPDERLCYQIAILRDPHSRGGSVSAHRDVLEGTALQISAPRNHFPLAAEGEALLCAGGIGITPLLCMAHQLNREGRAFSLHYCARTRAATAFFDELSSGAFADAVHFHNDDGPAAQQFRAAELLAQPNPRKHVYVCGPAGFIAHVLDTARARGWSESQLHSEAFSAPAATPGGTFELRLKRSGRCVQVAENQSAIEALQAAGVEVPISCEQGICGTCITNVLEGEPDHRDAYLTAAERLRNDCFTPCCVSRARTPYLVLDL